MSTACVESTITCQKYQLKLYGPAGFFKDPFYEGHVTAEADRALELTRGGPQYDDAEYDLPFHSDQVTDAKGDGGVQEMVGWLNVLLADDQVVELRALKPKPDWNGPPVVSAYFDPRHRERLAKIALDLSNHFSGVYFVFNPVSPVLLSRSANDVDIRRYVKAAKDEDVLCRRWLLIDVDPKHPSDSSSTAEEKLKAQKVIERIRSYLTERGWPEPVFADSGNGYHLLYRIDLPPQDGGLVKRVLVNLDSQFSTNDAAVDRQVFNASRLTKLYGTWARKGDHTPDRPHRRSCIVSIPKLLEVVPKELLEAVAGKPAELPANKKTFPTLPPATSDRTARVSQAAKWLEAYPGAVSGDEGHNHTFAAVCKLLEMGLDDDEALKLLSAWNQKCQPPWSEQELRHKIESAREKVGQAQVGDPLAGKEPNDPSRLARLFLGKKYTHPEGYTLRNWRDEWWRWQDGAYRPVKEGELRSEVWAEVQADFDSRTGFKLSTTLITNVLGAIASLTTVPGDVEQPSWLGAEEGKRASERIGMKNGLLDLAALWTGQGTDDGLLLPHTPQWFSRVCLPYDFDSAAQCPQWQAFLQKNLEGDADRIALIQEWCGYCLTADTSQQRFLVLEGEGCNGKSVACAVLTALLGQANVSHVPLEGFAQRFALTQTIGKLANIASEVGEIDRVAEGVLKSFTSGDRMMFDRKNIDPIEALPTARLVLATNNRPRFSDRSDGIWRRLLLLPFRVQIQEKDRVYGMDKPDWWLVQGEMPGIFNWAVDGLRRLKAQKRFTESQLCRDAKEDYKAECNSARQFLKEHCCQGPTDAKHAVPTSQLYNGYRDWAQDNGCQPVNSANFGRAVVQLFKNVEKKRIGSDGNRQQVYSGIHYLEPEPSYRRRGY
jgi:P4 family phage/plasmid primase-like protien